MYDTIISGGVVVDGTGAARKSADVAIKDGLIAEIGAITAPAREVIDADGALVTPGFVDVHTHYDGQFLWDDQLDPSFSHGVTTVIAGNCGVGFAPVNAFRQELMELMEGVEDIPGVVLEEGLDWNWRTFPDYLDRLAERSYALDVATHIPHAPLRVFAMGERALRHEQATGEDIEIMARAVREAMAAGAVGFSTGRLPEHQSSRGAHVPGTFASDEELLALAEAMGSSGHGVFQLIPRGTNGVLPLMDWSLDREGRIDEHARMEAFARKAGRPLTYSIAQFGSDPEDVDIMVARSVEARTRGIEMRPQTTPRGTSIIQSLDGYHIFLRKPAYREIEHLPRAERARAMRDPARRQAILAGPDIDGEYAENPFFLRMLNMYAIHFVEHYILKDPLDFEPTDEQKVRNLAVAQGKTPQEFAYDHLTEGDGDNFTVHLMFNYVKGSLDHIHDMLLNPAVVTGLADGGAHLRFICDASMPTFQLGFWTRDRSRGPTLPVELMVKKMAADTADLYGMTDRGRIAVGRKADLNVIDYDALTMSNPRIKFDLPSGAGRFIQESTGYLATIKSGAVTRRHDGDTGARPGRLVRSGSIH